MINETNKLTKKIQNHETTNQAGQKQNLPQIVTSQTQNQYPDNQTYATQVTKPLTQHNRSQTMKQNSNSQNTNTNESSNTSTSEYKTIITRIIANLSTLITLESIDTSSLDQINKAIENLISRIQNE
ncbi:hypothetical protein BpHYR1_005303 [Brachionus plicatilis]|uniref:Uncharacterized protein n=1 Tax=Brachionus plicatilis TaxID=10195 RepID=A0A3M7PRN4_BRAPC|nr:hypothetical protein BpHYR1_005303 [Brachionus plicatilis]